MDNKGKLFVAVLLYSLHPSLRSKTRLVPIYRGAFLPIWTTM